MVRLDIIDVSEVEGVAVGSSDAAVVEVLDLFRLVEDGVGVRNVKGLSAGLGPKGLRGLWGGDLGRDCSVRVVVDICWDGLEVAPEKSHVHWEGGSVVVDAGQAVGEKHHGL